MKFFVRIVAAMFLLLLVTAGSVFGYLSAISTGEAVPVLNSAGRQIPNSIYTIEKWTIGGIEQTTIIYGQNKDNPILLFLHGGPGLPEFPLINEIHKEIEKHATIIYWQQRGSVLSPVESTESLTAGRLVDDAIEIAEAARKRFGKERIYLVGHSWGTLLGMLVVDKRPDLFEAYLGLSQISDWSESDQRAYQWAVERAAAVGDQDALRELQDLAPYDSNDFEKKGVLLSYVTNYGAGALRDMDRAFELVIKPLASVREFTLSAKIGFFPTMVETTEAMLPELLTINLFDRIPQVEIPVYFIHGIHDQQVSYSLSKEYFEQLRAPEKKFFTFEHSAHGLIPEEPDRYTQILIEEFLKLKAPRTREVEVEPEGSIPHPIRP